MKRTLALVTLFLAIFAAYSSADTCGVAVPDGVPCTMGNLNISLFFDGQWTDIIASGSGGSPFGYHMDFPTFTFDPAKQELIVDAEMWGQYGVILSQMFHLDVSAVDPAAGGLCGLDIKTKDSVVSGFAWANNTVWAHGSNGNAQGLLEVKNPDGESEGHFDGFCATEARLDVDMELFAHDFGTAQQSGFTLQFLDTVPEPSSLILFGSGWLGLARFAFFKRMGR